MMRPSPARRPAGRRALARLVALAVVGGPAAACYRYTPLAASALRPGTPGEVRVELTAVAGETLAGALGPAVTVVDGRVRATDASRLVLAATRTLQRSGAESAWRGEEVAIPWTGVARLRERRFDGRRTALVAGAVVGGTLLAARAFGPGSSVSGNGRGGTSPAR